MYIRFISILFASFLILSCFPKESFALEKVLKLRNGAVAYCKLPSNVSKNKKYTLIVTLHGMGLSPKENFNYWKKVLKSDEFILLTPRAVGRKLAFCQNIDQNISNIDRFIDILKKKYDFSREDIILAGFSMGGNFAIDMSVKRPYTYRNVICIFGFYQDRHTKKLVKIQPRYLRTHHYYFITGSRDVTKKGLLKGYNQLSKKGASSQIDIYKNLYHNYPPHWSSKFKYIADLFTKNA